LLLLLLLLLLWVWLPWDESTQAIVLAVNVVDDDGSHRPCRL